ncbi:MAG: preprotein translocase subunit SecG [Chitinophagales bacterium]|jgi:preprotein translocase subunit SecG|nr:preprotein translocase subunit SecG [Chitinophagales bacterium]MCO5281083.1 preprotein translocase subunit SecG [Chitinophagales bacterium]OJV26215.1 MAG: preprotein translocase subunit SecG [Bacteroidetes bacterium 37-13]HRN95590.1 preprotein translocase subunit SecG [Chitinophagales bacterium]HRP40373.1 preprotein translocase subunit SecG [Chitinophagales bacterium]
MYIAITVLIIIVCVFLSLVVLIQNPKGGGLTSTFGGVGQQILGARRSTDMVEKATWTFAILLLVLSVGSAFFIDKRADVKTKTQIEKSEVEQQMNNQPFNPASLPQAAPAGGNTAPAQTAPAESAPAQPAQ